MAKAKHSDKFFFGHRHVLFGIELFKTFNIDRCRTYCNLLFFFHFYIERSYDDMIISPVLPDSKILTFYRLIEDIYTYLP